MKTTSLAPPSSALPHCGDLPQLPVRICGDPWINRGVHMTWGQRWICLPRRNWWIPHSWVKSRVSWLWSRVWILDPRPLPKGIQEFLIDVLRI